MQKLINLEVKFIDIKTLDLKNFKSSVTHKLNFSPHGPNNHIYACQLLDIATTCNLAIIVDGNIHPCQTEDGDFYIMNQTKISKPPFDISGGRSFYLEIRIIWEIVYDYEIKNWVINLPLLNQKK